MIGGAVLSHHRAYGSVHGGSKLTLQSLMLLEEAQEPTVSEVSSRDCQVHVGRTGVPPWSVAIVGGDEGPLALKPQLHELCRPGARSLPLPPEYAAQSAPQPLVKLLEGSFDLGELEVRDPAANDRLEPLDRPPQASTPPLSSQLADLVPESFHRLRRDPQLRL